MTVTINGSATLNGGATIKCVPAPPEDKLDDTWWEDNGNGFMNWSSGQNRWNYNFFNGGNTGLNVATTGGEVGWESGYEPASVDVTFNSGGSWSPPEDFITAFYDGSTGTGNVIGTVTTSFVATGTNYTINIPLDFSGTGDIKSFQFGFSGAIGEDSWYCSQITFNL